jgi:hypothetical protein
MNSSIVDLTDAVGFRIGEVVEPFELGRNLGEVAEMGRDQRALERRRGISDSNRYCFMTFPTRRFLTVKTYFIMFKTSRR